MKIYLNKINESWIIDRLKQEWIRNNKEITSNNIFSADYVWIIAPWNWRNLTRHFLKNKKVLCSIYHLDEKDLVPDALDEFYKRDKYVDEYHVISKKVIPVLSKLTPKKITFAPFWVNKDIFFNISDKSFIRNEFKIKEDSFLVGSFQRDSEGKDPSLPKLIKGPDQFIEVVQYLNQIHKNLTVILTGKRRDYVISQLKKHSINYKYFEMVNSVNLNKLYNMLDLYIVASRLEGGPQSIVECAISKTPIISTNVGIADIILSEESIFDMNNYSQAKPNIDVAYRNVSKLVIPEGYEEFKNIFKGI